MPPQETLDRVWLLFHARLAVHLSRYPRLVDSEVPMIAQRSGGTDLEL